MHLEIASYSVGALFRQVFLISAQWTSERDIAHMDAPLIVLNVPIYRAGLSRLDGKVEQLPLVRMINF